MTETVRTVMMLPADVKEKVKSVAGNRGMTEYVTSAIIEKLEGKPVEQPKPKKKDSDEVKALNKELGEARFLAQQLADTIVRFGDYENPISILQEIGLPDWIETVGWPADLAQLVPIPEPLADGSAPEAIPQPSLGVEQTLLPSASPSPETADAAAHDARFATKSDFLADILKKGEGLGLVRASEIQPPEPKAPEVEASEESGVVAEASVCPKCKNPMVGDECWECF